MPQEDTFAIYNKSQTIIMDTSNGGRTMDTTTSEILSNATILW